MITLTEITPSEKIPGRWYASFSDGGRLRVNTAILADFSLYAGKEIEEGEYEALKTASEKEAAKARALNILGNRSLSRFEIKDRLIKKGESEETAEETAAWLEKTGLINDLEYARALCRHYAGKGYGVMKIRDELFRRGVPKEYWEEALAEMPEPEETLDILIERKMRGRKPDKKELESLYGFLRRRGFSWEEIKTAVSRLDLAAEDDYE